MSTSTDPRAVIDVTRPTERHVHADQAWAALVAWNARMQPEPPILLRGDTLTRISHDEEHSKLATFTKPSLSELLSEAAVFWNQNANRGAGAFVAPPDYILSALLDRTPDKLPDALRINRVVEVPVFGALDADGHAAVLGIPGYDPLSRTYYAPPPGFPALSMPTGWGEEQYVRQTDGNVTALDYARIQDVQAASELILDLLVDFPFTDEASRSHAICMMLEPFVREAIGTSPTPMYGVMAHTPGTGKGLLTQVCLGVACGPDVPVMSFTGGKGFEAAENRKALTAKLMEAPPVVFFDNVTEPLDSGVLAAALTATHWSDRILGVSRMADVPIRNAWVFTANNPTISRELTRRIVPIFLDPGDIDPLTRTDWAHKLPQWANEHRAELVGACLTLAANYFAGELDVYAGDYQRPDVADVLASFPAWSKIMGGILKAAGIPGFLGNLDKLHAEATVAVNEHAAMLADWFERQAQPYTLRELPGVLGAHPAQGIREAELPLELRGHGDKFEVKLGTWLRDHRDEVIGGYRVRKVDGRPSKWRVEKVGA